MLGCHLLLVLKKGWLNFQYQSCSFYSHSCVWPTECKWWEFLLGCCRLNMTSFMNHWVISKAQKSAMKSSWWIIMFTSNGWLLMFFSAIHHEFLKKIWILFTGKSNRKRKRVTILYLLGPTRLETGYRSGSSYIFTNIRAISTRVGAINSFNWGLFSNLTKVEIGLILMKIQEIQIIAA